MFIRSANLPFITITIALCTAGALSGDIPDDEHSQLPDNRAMSCYACSTLDYRNFTNNICRFMPEDYDAQFAAVALNASDMDLSTTGPSKVHSLMAKIKAYDDRQPRKRFAESVENTMIPRKACSPEENFCSIVSIDRVEFVNDNQLNYFWALERNCSKSCNNGCLFVGERVKLRICSRCCKTPNCNEKNGAEVLWASKLVTIVTALITILLNKHSNTNN